MEEAETKIRQVTKNEFFAQTPKAAIDQKIFRIIREAEAEIKIPSLREAARRSLLRFYTAQYEELSRSFGGQLVFLAALFALQGRTLSGRKTEPTAAQRKTAVRTLEDAGYDASRLLGAPLQKFSKDYMRENVKPALDRLAAQQARDPDDITGRNTLRNKAEMEVRYQAHLDAIADFKAQGVKLVIASTHADCSERCRPWQGSVYSLDGTSGTTDDGRHYQPLENATDIYYTTKAGKTYKIRASIVSRSRTQQRNGGSTTSRRRSGVWRRMCASGALWRSCAKISAPNGIVLHGKMQSPRIRHI